MMLHSDKKHDNGLGMDATVTICHRYTPKEQLAIFCQNADIIITATGIYFLLLYLFSFIINIILVLCPNCRIQSTFNGCFT